MTYFRWDIGYLVMGVGFRFNKRVADLSLNSNTPDLITNTCIYSITFRRLINSLRSKPRVLKKESKSVESHRTVV